MRAVEEENLKGNEPKEAKNLKGDEPEEAKGLKEVRKVREIEEVEGDK